MVVMPEVDDLLPFNCLLCGIHSLTFPFCGKCKENVEGKRRDEILNKGWEPGKDDMPPVLVSFALKCVIEALYNSVTSENNSLTADDAKNFVKESISKIDMGDIDGREVGKMIGTVADEIGKRL